MSRFSTKAEYGIDANAKIREIKKLKEQLKDNTKDIRVYVDMESNPSIARAVKEIFGEFPDNHPDKNYITHEMYQKCMRIIRQAGKAKGSVLLNKAM